MPRLLLRQLDLAGPEVDLGERRDRLGGVGVAADLERHGEGLLEERDRLVRLPQEEGEAAERRQELARVGTVVDLLVERAAPSRRTSARPPTDRAARRRAPPGSSASRRPARVVERLGELERALDVLARSLPVALPPVAARPPAEDPRPQSVARDARPLGELQRLREERQRRRDRRQPVAATAEAEEHLGAVDVGEHRVLHDLPGPREERQRLPHLADVHAAPTTPRAVLAARGPRPSRRERASISPSSWIASA